MRLCETEWYMVRSLHVHVVAPTIEIVNAVRHIGQSIAVVYHGPHQRKREISGDYGTVFGRANGGS